MQTPSMQPHNLQTSSGLVSAWSYRSYLSASKLMPPTLWGFRVFSMTKHLSDWFHQTFTVLVVGFTGSFPFASLHSFKAWSILGTHTTLPSRLDKETRVFDFS